MRYIPLFMLTVALSMGQLCPPNTTPDTSQPPATNENGTGNDNASDPADDTVDPGTPSSQAIVADHLAPAAFDSIPAATITSIRSNYRIWYGHTSHGSQIVTGMQMIYSADSRFAFNAGEGSLSIQEDGGVDLGHEGDLGWVDITRNVLNEPGNNINVVMWSWCAGVQDNTEAGIAAYLNAMNALETEYPSVRFVYMTGHLDGTGPEGNLYARNNQIREYCASHNKILFDFADIESYNPAGVYFPNGTDWCEWCTDWMSSHSCPACEDCAHSQCFNCYQKGRAFWWMMARLAG